jgi:hypothetical protein
VLDQRHRAAEATGGRRGRIIASAQDTEQSRENPQLLGFAPGEGQRAFEVDVPEELLESRRFLADLNEKYIIDASSMSIRAKLVPLK